MDLSVQQCRSVASWFLGPMAENRDEFNELVEKVLNYHEDSRIAALPNHPSSIKNETRRSKLHKAEMKHLEVELDKMNEKLKFSIPLFHPRQKGYMGRDATLPSLLGYISGMLWNQNNIEIASSPVTTVFEVTVAKQLCDLLGFRKDNGTEPWGHLTSCGSIANIEALWAARDLKFLPIAIKNAISKDKRLQSSKHNFCVYVPSLNKEVGIAELQPWDLMNLDIDDVCRMRYKVAEEAGVSIETLSSIIDGHTIVSMGTYEFMKANKLAESPVLFVPATHHYSLPKAATLLGLGYNSLISLPLDVNCRQDTKELEKKLQQCLDSEIPVIAVVVVVGSTNESAVDPVEEILRIREQFKRKGLSFCIHIDAAWGGYLSSMLKDPACLEEYLPTKSTTACFNCNGAQCLNFNHQLHNASDESSGSNGKAKSMSKIECEACQIYQKEDTFVPVLPLSPYVARQYEALKHAETITIDPHKTGFCLFPSGALCYRNSSMRDFISLLAPELFHEKGDPSLGLYGLEGSKPGAAAASVLLSHNVIGLDKSGYGRLLGQCMYGAKLFYCMWMTAAKENDPFICVNLIKSESTCVNDSKKFIRERILGKSNKDICQDELALKFLSEVGPDTLINAFAVNFKNEDGSMNEDIKLANELQASIFKELSCRDKIPTKRIPMFLTSSSLPADQYSATLFQFKTRLLLKNNNENKTQQELIFLKSTIMDPIHSSAKFVQQIKEIFRNTVWNCIGRLRDEPSHHEFVLGELDEDGNTYCAYIQSFDHTGHHYDVILKLKIPDISQSTQIRGLQRSNSKQPLLIHTVEKTTMFDITHSRHNLCFEVWLRRSPEDNQLVKNCISVHVDEVIRYRHLEPTDVGSEQPLALKYFLFGCEKEAYLLHCVTKRPDFFQFIHLNEIPCNVELSLLDLGVEVSIMGLTSGPLVVDGTAQEHSPAREYPIQFSGKDDAITTSSLLGMKEIWQQALL